MFMSDHGDSPDGQRRPSRDSSLLASLFRAVGGYLKGPDEGEALVESMRRIVAEAAIERGGEPLTREEQRLLGNLLRFGDLTVEDVMVPRTQIVAVEAATPLPELLAIFGEAQHSRLPVYRETLDEPLGMVHIKDVVGYLARGSGGEGLTVADCVREALFVPPSMPVIDLLAKMQASRIHLALVIDEYGGTDGLLTIEDVVEQIVGEIDDEHDTDADDPVISRHGSGWEADAAASLEDFERRTGLSLALAEDDEEVDTLNGIVTALAGRVPLAGETILHPAGPALEVLEADARRVLRLRIRPAGTERSAPAGEAH